MYECVGKIPDEPMRDSDKQNIFKNFAYKLMYYQWVRF